ncbi:SDR family oxidoreductase [Erwinia tracheiphila]|uniref:SDR family NAD(P)-dependent oxidoreductase n=1 Tax=Erwinia tracheiphila TaxID=65700 RepID=A0A345CX24_9GAMM|nr:SDR family oxidoreductase [Erwinia tracheiphila]AXF77991.1 SDR family NAD(P)-dependent oxidoreductase [Erwinia tracheiphila]UIA83295.1 SDR family oxidoreductase [Erwinia tracheiphila]UIA91874.1 SDR family oxidoreductase [Erwinia tracheiphila]
MIAITGANGQLGRLVINALLKKMPSEEIVAAVRSPEKATDLAELGVQVREADYAKPELLSAAFRGVDKLLLISSSEVGRRTPQHQAVIEAAKEAGVELLAYTSLLRADTSEMLLANEHRETEQALTASGIPYAILRNGWYTENYAHTIAAALAYGTFIGAAQDGKIASASRQDYADAAAEVLTGSDVANKIYELAGDTAFTLAEFTAEIARQSGKTINYVNLPEAEFAHVLKGAGLLVPLAEVLADSEANAAKGSLFDDSQTLSALIGRPTTSWQQVVTDNVSKTSA